MRRIKMKIFYHRNNNPLLSGLRRLVRKLKSTELKEELDQSNSYLSIALKGTEYGEWSWNMSTDEVILSLYAMGILGYEKKDKIMKEKSFLDMIHPEDKSKILYEIDKHKSGVTDFVSVDIRMKSAYGYWNWINMRGRIIEFDDAGLPLRFFGLNYDINEQKQFDSDVENLQRKMIQDQEYKKMKSMKEDKVTIVSKELDQYSRFRLNGLRNLLN